MADHRLHAAFLLGATTGMRRGEVLGLRWTNVDLRRRRIKVVETVLNIAYEITEGTPKTARGRRTVAIDAATVEALRDHRRKQAVERAAAGSDWTELDLVFTRPDGTYVHPDIYSQTFRRAVRRLGLPYIRLHDLRHTHATLGLEAGIPVKVMSTRLGHATTAFTQDVYMHSVPSLEDSAADQIADLIFGSDDEPPQE
jgi:integrase